MIDGRVGDESLERTEAECFVDELADERVAIPFRRNLVLDLLNDAAERAENLRSHRRVVELLRVHRRKVQLLDEKLVNFAAQIDVALPLELHLGRDDRYFVPRQMELRLETSAAAFVAALATTTVRLRLLVRRSCGDVAARTTNLRSGIAGSCGSLASARARTNCGRLQKINGEISEDDRGEIRNVDRLPP